MPSHLTLAVHGQLTDCMVPMSCGYKPSPNPRPSITVLDSWYEAFVLIYCLGYAKRSAVHLNFSLVFPKDIIPEVMWIVQM